MATRAKRNKKRELVWGVGALALTLAVLLAIAFGLSFGTPQELPGPTAPETTAALLAEPTLPPLEANPYGPTDFQYQGRYLTCLAGDSMLGIDVSEHQTVIDWAAVGQAGIEFVMIRVGYRGFESGALFADTAAQASYQGAKAAGLRVGAYFFSQAVNTAEALEEAQFALEAIEDWELDMPLVYDWEYVSQEARTGAVDSRTLTDCTIAFCDAVREAGFQPMVYFNQSQGRDLLHLEELADYGFWLAMYSDRMTYPYKLAMWQYTCQGAVPGIAGDVDLNLYFPG